ncbi:hypothetical protein BGZ70_008593 [Mortierella alpina]|uniref:Uncharacterized protein n=1 Tax=Mortierella alpina TaxID=64518 RepID=A0A9P6JFN1_MORAP|nr:hypothetical protein BGZ70_008593 [Mortierella alpina]
MCHRVVCNNCGKFTWEGCGLHIAQALAGLSLEQICSCDDGRGTDHTWTAHSDASSSKAGSKSTPVKPAALEGLKRGRQETEQELKEANQDALQRLLKGLLQASDIE